MPYFSIDFNVPLGVTRENVFPLNQQERVPSGRVSLYVIWNVFILGHCPLFDSIQKIVFISISPRLRPMIPNENWCGHSITECGRQTDTNKLWSCCVAWQGHGDWSFASVNGGCLIISEKRRQTRLKSFNYAMDEVDVKNRNRYRVTVVASISNCIQRIVSRSISRFHLPSPRCVVTRTFNSRRLGVNSGRLGYTCVFF